MRKIGFLSLLLVGAVAFLIGCGKTEQKKKDYVTYSEYTSVKLYHEIPALITEHTKIGEAIDYGKGNYVLEIQGAKKEDYDHYVALLKEAGLKQYSDSGKEGFEGFVYSTTFQKGKMPVVVTYAKRLEKVYVMASKDLPLSEHLVYDETSTKKNVGGAKTKIYFPQLDSHIGFSAIIQLKNGNFVIHDGGTGNDAKKLVDQLEKLTPEGQKPVIEGWFLSHSHIDHVGALQTIAIDKGLSSRICVEGIYFFTPSGRDFGEYEEYPNVKLLSYALKAFNNTEGMNTPVFRPQFGQRYYFNDLVIDISVTMEMEPYASHEVVSYNDLSVYMMHYIDGQKFFTTGDGDHATQKTAMRVYEESYFDMEVYMVPHHAINVYNYFTDYCSIDTAIYPRNGVKSDTAPEENIYLVSKVKEAYSREDGIVVLTFPYTVGTAEILVE